MAAQRGAMKSLTGKLSEVRAARARISVGTLDRTLIVIESQELLAGQKRGISVALRKAKEELAKLERLIEAGRLTQEQLKGRVDKALAREHLSSFVVASVGGSDQAPTLQWHVDAALRRELETTRSGRAVTRLRDQLVLRPPPAASPEHAGVQRQLHLVPEGFAFDIYLNTRR